MINLLKTIGILSLCMLSVACDNFENHPYSMTIKGKRDINGQNIKRLERSELKVPYKFAFITDTQGSLDETKDALQDIKSRGDISFIIHGGDQADFGLPKEFVWTRDMMESCELPYLTIIGNHDCLGNGNDTFDYIYGAENFSLNIGHTHFVGLNTVALEYDYSHPVPDLDFIENDIIGVDMLNAEHQDSITHTVITMHSRPYDEQFNNNIAKAFNLYISHYPGLKKTDEQTVIVTDGITQTTQTRGFCINGHNHNTDVTDIFGNGILYFQCANIAKRQYFVFTITDEGYEYETVDF